MNVSAPPAATFILIQVRRRDPDLLRLIKYELDECCLCGVTHSLHLHHVLLRSRGGDDVRANIVCLDLQCHHDYHRGHKRRDLADYVLAHRPDTIDYLIEKLGVGGAQVWFEQHTK